MQCRLCETPNPDDNLFCEGCGARIAAGGTASSDLCACGAALSEMDAEGFCGSCGRRVKPPDSDHIELSLLPDFAGVSDRGLRHHRNEDRFVLATAHNAYALVVCDGVSMSPDADEAATAAVQSALEAINEGFSQPETAEIDLLRSVIRKATQAVAELGKRRTEAPATTLVAAIVKNNRLTVGWIGDSRAYWLTGIDGTQITRDHSWQNSPAGREANSEAQKTADAHALTRWVGADSPDLEPEIVQQPINGAGQLLLCSDGLWNYTDDTKEIAALVASANAPGADALAVCRTLVEFARTKGGHDNITAAILRHPVSENQSHGG